MSPAPITEEVQLDLHLDQFQAVGKAFDALLLTLYRLTHRHNELKEHSESMFKEVYTVSPSIYPCHPPKSHMTRKFD